MAVATRVLAILLCLLALPTLLALPSLAGEPPSPPPAKAGTTCIDAPAVMRRDHPGMLMHQRDDTLRLGIRGGKASLKDCVACHATAAADGTPVPVNAPGQFCQACHAYAAVQPDCFECHATTPPLKTAGGAP